MRLGGNPDLLQPFPEKAFVAESLGRRVPQKTFQIVRRRDAALELFAKRD